MTCPHATVSANTIACAVLRATGGPSQVAGPGMAHYPCDRCRSEWQNGEPPTVGDEATYTPTIRGYLERTAKAKQMSADRPRGTGLGDMVHAVTSALGIPECGGCAKRREWLNKIRLGG